MKFTTAAAAENVVWEMRLADWPRALNRTRINNLANGAPPYTPEEQRQNRITTNVNFLEFTKLLMDARRQGIAAFNSSDPLFTITLDYGPQWKRSLWSSEITKAINRPILRSRRYDDKRRSTWALDVLHGISPSNWEDRWGWCPKACGVEDVLVPSGTLTSLENLQMFAVYRKYTALELWQRTHGPKVDPAWDIEQAEHLVRWANQEAMTLMGSTWPDVWSPEKMAERFKEDSGLYASDTLPTIDTFDVYYWDDAKRRSGWRRRTILDAWGDPGVGGAGGAIYKKDSRPEFKRHKAFEKSKDWEFLYDSGDRVYAESVDQIMHWQFADCSAVAPFRYHSVRSMGFLLYAVCQLQNRLRCRFNDSVFEALLQYFRVNDPADAERLSKVDLLDKAVIPAGLEFVKAGDRWQVPTELAEAGMQLNRQTMIENSANFVQDFDLDKEAKEETATRTMAKVNATAALVGAMLGESYNQMTYEYREIARRFCQPNSRDADVRKFRLEVLKAGVPEEALNADRWDVQPVRVIGSGNKLLQVAMSDKLMAIRGQLGPEAQQDVDRIYILANSDDPKLAERLVPVQKRVSDASIEGQRAAAQLMLGLPAAVQSGINHADYVEALLHSMATVLQRLETPGQTPTQNEIIGLANMAGHIEQNIGIIAQDPQEKERVRQYQDDLRKMNNLVKAHAQRFAEQQKKTQGAGMMDPATMAKIQAIVIQAQTKAKIASESHAQRTAQRQIQFEQQIEQDRAEHTHKLLKTNAEAVANLNLHQHRMASLQE